MNISVVSYTISSLLILQSPVLCISALISLYSDKQIDQFSILMYLSIISVAIGFILKKSSSSQSSWEMDQSYFIEVPLIWLVFGIIVSFFFKHILMHNEIPFSLIIFEAFSSITTSGISFLDKESVSKGFRFYNAFLSFYGGIGILISFIVIGGSALTKMSSNRATQIENGISDHGFYIANILYKIISIYFAITFVAFLCYSAFGVTAFESIISAISSSSTSGLNLNTEGHEIGIKIVTILILFLSSLPLAFIFTIKNHRAANVQILNDQIKAFFLFVCIIYVICCLASTELTYSDNKTLTAVNIMFNIMSCISTAGFEITENFNQSKLMIIFTLLTFIGGCSGSTTGGIKIDNFIIWFKGFFAKIKSLMNNNIINIPMYDKQPIQEDKYSFSGMTILLFMFTLIIFTTTFSLIGGLNISDSLNWSSSLLTTSGIKNMNIDKLTELSSFSRILFLNLSSLLMLLGRIGAIYFWFNIVYFGEKIFKKHSI